MRHFIRENTWLMGLSTGWGNGYVVIPPGHPLDGKSFGEIHELISDLDVHYGLTFSCSANELTEDWQMMDCDKDGWVVGFDTCHYGDSPERWPMEAVAAEAKRLADQLLQYKSPIQ